jgi:pimeloyl-ACP methyl ester carboxylesterase
VVHDRHRRHLPGEQYQAPCNWTEWAHPPLIQVHEVDRGGHFAAWEEPELFATEVPAAFRPLCAPQIPEPRR